MASIRESTQRQRSYHPLLRHRRVRDGKGGPNAVREGHAGATEPAHGGWARKRRRRRQALHRRRGRRQSPALLITLLIILPPLLTIGQKCSDDCGGSDGDGDDIDINDGADEGSGGDSDRDEGSDVCASNSSCEQALQSMTCAGVVQEERRRARRVVADYSRLLTAFCVLTPRRKKKKGCCPVD